MINVLQRIQRTQERVWELQRQCLSATPEGQSASNRLQAQLHRLTTEELARLEARREAEGVRRGWGR